MGRLIDEDLLKKNCKCTGTFENNFQCVSLKTLGEVIDTQPTAYDPDKVVDQLNDKFRVVRTDEDLEWNRAMDEEITIVNGGGADDN